MDWSFTANTSTELAHIGKALFNASKQKHLDEQMQMARLLEALSTTPVLQYPVRVRHTGETGTPDFQLESGGQRIGAEVSKIAVQDVEHARGLQGKELKGTLAISSLYQTQSKPRTKDEVIAEGFITPSFVSPVTVAEYNSIWLNAVTAELEDKTIVLQSGHFDRGVEDWLVLWDRIGTAEDEVEQRIESVCSILASRWKLGWYSHVFLQDESFRWSVMFTSSGHLLFDSSGSGRTP